MTEDIKSTSLLPAKIVPPAYFASSVKWWDDAFETNKELRKNYINEVAHNAIDGYLEDALGKRHQDLDAVKKTAKNLFRIFRTSNRLEIEDNAIYEHKMVAILAADYALKGQTRRFAYTSYSICAYDKTVLEGCERLFDIRVHGTKPDTTTLYETYVQLYCAHIVKNHMREAIGDFADEPKIYNKQAKDFYIPKMSKFFEAIARKMYGTAELTVDEVESLVSLSLLKDKGYFYRATLSTLGYPPEPLTPIIVLNTQGEIEFSTDNMRSLFTASFIASEALELPKSSPSEAEEEQEDEKRRADDPYIDCSVDEQIKALQVAIQNHEFDTVCALLDHNPALVNTHLENNTTPLYQAIMIAAKAGKESDRSDSVGSRFDKCCLIVSTLRERGADPHTPNKGTSETPLTLLFGIINPLKPYLIKPYYIQVFEKIYNSSDPQALEVPTQSVPKVDLEEKEKPTAIISPPVEDAKLPIPTSTAVYPQSTETTIVSDDKDDLDLCEAIRNNDTEKLKTLLDQHPELINQPIGLGLYKYTPLYRALEQLIGDLGEYDLFGRSADDDSAKIKSRIESRLGLIDQLIQQGADRDLRVYDEDKPSETPGTPGELFLREMKSLPNNQYIQDICKLCCEKLGIELSEDYAHAMDEVESTSSDSVVENSPSQPSNNPGFFASISSFSSRHPIFTSIVTFGLADIVACGATFGIVAATSYGMAGNSSYLTAHIGAGIASWHIPLMVGAAAFGLFLLYNRVKACSNAPSSDSQTLPKSQYGTLDESFRSDSSATSQAS